MTLDTVSGVGYKRAMDLNSADDTLLGLRADIAALVAAGDLDEGEAEAMVLWLGAPSEDGEA